MAEKLLLEFDLKDNASPKLTKINGQLTNIGNNFDKTNIKANNLDNGLGKLGRQALIATGAFIALDKAVDLGGSFIKTADAMTNANSRLQLATNNTYELVTAQKALFDIAQDTRIAYTATVDLFERMATSTRDFGLEQKKLLDITELVNKAMIVSGGTTESMNAAVIQFGQAMSADWKSVGQELASLREQTPRLYRALVEGMDTTMDGFKKMAEEGKLSTTIIIEALEKAGYSIEKDFSKVNKTVDQSMTQVRTSMGKFVEIVDKSTGATKALSDTVTDFSKALGSFDDESINKFIDIGKNIALAGGSLLAINTTMKVSTKIATSHAAAMALLGGSYTSLNARILLATASQVAFNKAFKASLFGAAATGVFLLADSFLEADKRADSFRKTLKNTNAEILLMDSQNRLREVNAELKDFDDRFKGYSDNQKLMYKGAYDLLYKEKTLLENNIKLIQEKNKPTINDTTDIDNNKKSYEAILKIQNEINKTLDPQGALIAKINEKYDTYKKTLIDSNAVQAELFDLEKARNKELDGINDKFKDFSTEVVNISDVLNEAFKFDDSDFSVMFSGTELISNIKEVSEGLRIIFKDNQDALDEINRQSAEEQKRILEQQTNLWTDSIISAIDMGINGSNLEEILQTGISGFGNMMLQSSMQQAVSTSLTSGVGAVSSGNWAMMGAGVALSAASSIFGGGDRISETEKANNAFDKFIENLNDASAELNEFGNIGTSSSNELNFMISEIAKYNQALVDIPEAIKTYYYKEAEKVMGYTSASGSYTIDDQTFAQYSGREYAQTNALEYVNQQLENYTDKLSDTTDAILSQRLDLSSFTIDELEGFLPDGIKEDISNTSKQIAILAFEAKELSINGEELSKKKQIQLATLYNEIALNEDYSDVLAEINDRTEDFNDTLSDTIKQMQFTSNDYELAFASIGATTEDITDLRKQQIQEEIDFLISKTPELADAKDDFLSFYDGINPENTNLINSAEEVGDLLIEQAALNYELSDSLKNAQESLASFISSFNTNMELIGKSGADAIQINLDAVNEDIENIIAKTYTTSESLSVSSVQTTSEERIIQLYEKLLRRTENEILADKDGIDYWVGRLNDDLGLNEIVAAITEGIGKSGADTYDDAVDYDTNFDIDEIDLTKTITDTFIEASKVFSDATADNITGILNTIGTDTEAFGAGQELADLFYKQAKLEYDLADAIQDSAETVVDSAETVVDSAETVVDRMLDWTKANETAADTL
ncbi:MAG: tape measure protein, partial [Campylobacterota bacterium]|nr:tape measure protein [Campylobacterota bacterium]